jgi:hypothetical protein
MKKVAVAIFLFAWTLTTHGKYSASGDEPHYLIMTQSLVADRDLDLANNYAGNDGRLFGHDHLDVGLHAIPARTGHTRSIHDVGLGVGLVPVYVVAQQIAQLPSAETLKRFRMDRGLFTYSIVGLFLIGLTAGSLMLLGLGLAELAGPRIAAAVVLVLGISPPVVSHSFLVFPEVVALSVSCAVVWFALKRPSDRDVEVLLALVLAIGLLPWMHHKFLLYAPGLLALIACERWPLVRGLSRATAAVAAALFLLPQAALHVYTLQEWGTLGGALTTERLPFSFDTFKTGWAGVWVDRQQGLLAFAPVFWLFAASAILTVRRTWPYVAVSLLVYVPAAAYVVAWWAGFAPAARYVVPVIPLWTVPIADALRFRPVRMAAIVLLVPQLLIDAVVWQHPRWLWPATPTNAALDALGPIGRAYEALLPPLQVEGLGWSALPLGLLGIALSAAIVAAVRLAGEPVAGPTPKEQPATPA